MNLHQVYGLLISYNSFSIVMEFADDGDLFQKITKHKKNNNELFEETEIWRVFIQVCQYIYIYI